MCNFFFIAPLGAFKCFAFCLLPWNFRIELPGSSLLKFFVLDRGQIVLIQWHVLLRSGNISYTIYLIISFFPFSLLFLISMLSFLGNVLNRLILPVNVLFHLLISNNFFPVKWVFLFHSTLFLFYGLSYFWEHMRYVVSSYLRMRKCKCWLEALCCLWL